MNSQVRIRQYAILAVGIVLILSIHSVFSQAKPEKAGTPVMWEKVNIKKRDLVLGPGGRQMQPDISKITFIKAEKTGYSQKYKIKDGKGRTWVGKVGLEAQSETAAVRLLWAIGYKTEINYLVPKLTIPGAGEFTNVRLEARPDSVKRLDQWQWNGNPFKGTRQLQGLKIMMSFFNNWDMKNANNVIVQDGSQLQYVISDLGVSFGKTGSSGSPLFWRIGRSRNAPDDYYKSDFIKGVNHGHIKFAFNGKNMGLFNDITTDDGRWLADLLLQLTDKQIRDAFRAANYSESDIRLLTFSVKHRIAELDRVSSGRSP